MLIGLGLEEFAGLAAKAMAPKPVFEVDLAHIHAPTVSVREQATVVVDRLRRQGTMTFRALSGDSPDTLTTVARFLALLELFREGVVSFDQVTPLGELTVRWTGGEDEDVEITDEFDGEPEDQPEAGAAGGAGRARASDEPSQVQGHAEEPAAGVTGRRERDSSERAGPGARGHPQRGRRGADVRRRPRGGGRAQRGGRAGRGDAGGGRADEESSETLDIPLADLRPALEAVLMVADQPLDHMTLASAVGYPPGEVASALHELAEEYAEQGRGFDLRNVAGGWRYYTREEFASVVERFVLDGQQARLTQAALETLAVVAYKQPVSRARVSAVRGVNVDGVMRTLVARGLVEEAGHDGETTAMLYRTTSYFLERIGVESLDDLPELAPFLPDMGDFEDLDARPEPADVAADPA